MNFYKRKNGNNNTYCQDNELSWINWRSDQYVENMKEFVSKLCAFRASHQLLTPERYSDYDSGGKYFINWHGRKLYTANWKDEKTVLSWQLGFNSSFFNRDSYELMCLVNGSPQNQSLPLPNGRDWELVLDTSQEYPYDIRWNRGLDHLFVKNNIEVHKGAVCILKRNI